MILDLSIFMRRGFLVDHVHPAETLRGESRGCKTRKEAVVDRDTTDLSAMVK